MDATARTTVVNWVNLGGTLVLMADFGNTYLTGMANGLFGWGLGTGIDVWDSSPIGQTPAAAGTTFAAAPPALPAHDGTYMFDPALLPPEAIVIYAYDPANVALVLIPVGDGYVILWARDLFNSNFSGGSYDDNPWGNAMSIILSSANSSLF